jgi:hypothetical protein
VLSPLVNVKTLYIPSLIMLFIANFDRDLAIF